VSKAKKFLNTFSDVQPLLHVISTVTALINDEREIVFQVLEKWLYPEN